MYREKKKEEMLKLRINYNNKKNVKTQTIQAYFGVVEIIPFPFQNPKDIDAAFTFEIKDSEEDIIGCPELFLVKDPKEWKELVFNKNFPEPPEWECIQ